MGHPFGDSLGSVIPVPTAELCTDRGALLRHRQSRGHGHLEATSQEPEGCRGPGVWDDLQPVVSAQVWEGLTADELLGVGVSIDILQMAQLLCDPSRLAYDDPMYTLRIGVLRRRH